MEDVGGGGERRDYQRLELLETVVGESGGVVGGHGGGQRRRASGGLRQGSIGDNPEGELYSRVALVHQGICPSGFNSG